MNTLEEPNARSGWMRLYRRLLAAYPSDIRAQSGRDMAELFADLLEDKRRRGRLAAIVFALRAYCDLLGGALSARRLQSPPFTTQPSRRSLMLRNDLRFAWRQLRRSPGFALLTVVSLALGIGATTAMFSAVNSIVLRPPKGVEDPQQLISIFTGTQGKRLYGNSSLLDFEEFSDIPALESSAAFTLDILDLGTESGRRTLLAESVSGGYFQVVRMRPALGRTFLPDETRPGAARKAVVISHALWEGEYGKDPSILGRTVLINQLPFTVVGVAAPGFVSRVLSMKADLWVPLGIPDMVSEEYQPSQLKDRQARSFSVIGRLRPDATVEQAQAQLDVVSRRLQKAYGEDWKDANGQMLRLTAVVGESGLPPKAREAAGAALTALMVPVALVLLIACSNVANMQLARATRRHREMALRLALGAGRMRLVFQLLTESLLPAAAGGLLGLGVAYYGSRLFNDLQIYGLPFPFDVRLDGRVLLFTLLTSVGAGLFFGLVPALRASRPDLVPALKREFSESGSRPRRFSLRNMLVIVQVSGSFMLVAGSILFLRSQQAAGRIDPGFDAQGVVAARLNLSLDFEEKTPEAMLQQLTGFKQRLEREPGVESVSLAGSLPLSLMQRSTTVRVPGRHPDALESRELGYNVVTPDYFDLMRIPIAAGRPLQAGDTLASAPSALVNQTMARLYWPGENPIGKSLELEDFDQTVQVVGVVRDHKQRFLAEEPTPHLWLPLSQNPVQPYLMVLARTRGETGPALALLSREVEAFTGRPPLLPPAPMREMIDVSLMPNRLAASFLGLTGAVALFLALVGLYGVVAYTVSLRTREMGIRLAVGAAKSSVIGLVVRQALSLTGVGLLFGAPLAMALGAVASHLLYGISPFDPLTHLGVALLLSLAALLAGLAPALRAASLDPVQTLRFE